MTKVLFVCTGNICRSPTAEAVFLYHIRQSNLQDVVYVDSAGTHDYHIGECPDRRSQQAAFQRGFDMSALKARQVHKDDFIKFNYILAMDHDHLAILKRLCPNSFQGHLGLFMEFSDTYRGKEVPDPYYGNAAGFEIVLDMVDSASEGLIQKILDNHKR